MPSRSRKNRKVVIVKALIEEDMVVVEEYHPLVLIVVIWATYHNFVLNNTLSMGTITVPSMLRNIARIC
jgi:hypothetical protein